MVELTIIGFTTENYEDTKVRQNDDHDWEYYDGSFVRYYVYCKDDEGTVYQIELWSDEGVCSSGYKSKTRGYMYMTIMHSFDIANVEFITDDDSPTFEINIKLWLENENAEESFSCRFFEYSHYGSDDYYPSGQVDVEYDYFLLADTYRQIKNTSEESVPLEFLDLCSTSEDISSEVTPIIYEAVTAVETALVADADRKIDKDMIRLISSDGDSFDVFFEEIKISELVKNCITDDEDEDRTISLPNVNTAILAKVIEFAHHNRNDPMSKIVKPLKSANMKENVQEWYAEFVNIEEKALFELILAARYMDIVLLIDLTCAKVASMIKDKSPDEIIKNFSSDEKPV